MENAPRKLYRSRDNKVIAGVCGGLGKYFEIDPIIFRIFFVLLTLVHGVGILLYILLIIFIPKEGEAGKMAGDTGDRIKQAAQDFSKEARDFADRMNGDRPWLSRKRNIIGLIIIVVGILLLANSFFPLAWLSFKIVAIIGLILIGLYIIFKK